MTDRLPLTARITGMYRAVWALHAEGLGVDDIAARLALPSAHVRRAVTSVYRALAIDPDDGALTQVQAAQLYRAAQSHVQAPPGERH